MQNVMAEKASRSVGVPVGRPAAARAQVRQMPLSFLRRGEAATIVKVRGKEDMHHHLESLGFVEGAGVEVLSEQRGDIIVEIKGAHVALDKHIAAHIITSAAA